MLEIALALQGSLTAAWSIRVSFGKHLYMNWHQQPMLMWQGVQSKRYAQH